MSVALLSPSRKSSRGVQNASLLLALAYFLCPLASSIALCVYLLGQLSSESLQTATVAHDLSRISHVFIYCYRYRMPVRAFLSASHPRRRHQDDPANVRRPRTNLPYGFLGHLRRQRKRTLRVSLEPFARTDPKAETRRKNNGRASTKNEKSPVQEFHRRLEGSGRRGKGQVIPNPGSAMERLRHMGENPNGLTHKKVGISTTQYWYYRYDDASLESSPPIKRQPELPALTQLRFPSITYFMG